MILLEIGIGIIILTSVIVFLSVILLLVLVLLYARKKLTPQGDVTITINEEKEMITNPGSTLLSTLSAEKIFIPSACGGGGTCGMCKVQVHEGAGSIFQRKRAFLPGRSR